jgi:hypothetical protein
MYLLSFILLLTSPAIAEQPKFTILRQNQCAPFDGALFDKQATAQILSTYDRFLPACDARVQYELEKQKNKYEFDINVLKIEQESTIKEYTLYIENKDKEISALTKSLKKTTPQNKLWWFAGGALAGAAITYGAYRAFDEK